MRDFTRSIDMGAWRHAVPYGEQRTCAETPARLRRTSYVGCQPFLAARARGAPAPAHTRHTPRPNPLVSPQ